MNFGWRVVVTLRSKGKTSLKNMVDAAAQRAGRHKRVLPEATNAVAPVSPSLPPTASNLISNDINFHLSDTAFDAYVGGANHE